jgi:hypothetical protein
MIKPIIRARDPKTSTKECIASARRARLPVTTERASLANTRDMFKIREYKATRRIADSLLLNPFQNLFMIFLNVFSSGQEICHINQSASTI